MNKNLYNALTSFTYRTLLLVAVSVLLLAACTRSPAPEASVPGAPDTFRGLAQITFSDLNSDQPQSQMTFHPLSGVEGQALTALTGGLELGTVTPGGFTFNGVTTDDCDNTGGTRFLYASYEVRNADMSGAAYTVARKNLTFLAIDNNGADYGDNAVASLSDAGGNLFAPDDATAIDFANCLKPTHQTESDGTGLQVVPNGADMQVFTESEISGLGLIGTGTISNVFPYGYVVRNTAGGRTLAASPAAGQFDGVITFAVRVPDSDTNFPQSFSLWFYVFENDETFVTEDLTEQGSGTAEVRADTLDASTPIRLLGNSSTTPTGNPTNRLCQVRTSGTDASPNKLLVEVTGDICFTDERIYVNENATGGNDGTTWAEAFTTLQDALAAARSNTAVKEIWVAGGTYYPDEGAATNSAGATLISPNDNRSATFFVSEGIKIYGGFAGGETNRSGRDPVANLVTLSGDIDQNTGLNAYHVMYLDGSTTAITNATVIDGVTVTAGQANGSSPNERGGGMYNLSSSPTLTNVTFSGNTASNSGGAMYNYDSSSPTLTDVTFSGNLARFGGAMFNYASSPTLTNVTFSGNSSDNSSSSGGGAMYNSSSSPTLTNVTFSDNSASGSTTDNGGAMFNTGSSPTLNNVTFSGNSASGRGGTMYNSGSSPALNNVTFSGNSASDRGGAMYNNNSSSPTLTNVTFSGNSASFGGAMYNADSSPTLTNVTFSDNSASDNGGAMYNSTGSPTLTNVTFSGNSANDDGGAMYSNYSSSPTLTNVILWSNTATNGGNQIFQNRGILTINYSIVQGGSDGISLFNSGSSTYSSGTGNLNADPLFTDANGPDNISGTADDDLSLQACSPAIDAGDNTAISLATDLAGNSRNVDDTGVDDTGNGTAPIVDIGALEFQGVSASCNVIRVDKNATGNDLGYTWDDAVPNLQDALAIARSSDRKEIWIADGTYYPDEGAATDRTGATLASPDNNRNATFFVGEGIKIYGGFAGGETNRSGRDPAANVVTLSGDIDQGINPNAYHVMYLDGSTTAITNATVIDGVTVTAGQADGSSFPDSAGGAMFNTNSSPTLNNVTFSGNTASNSGGAMYNRDGSSPTLTDATFSSNTADYGGAMYNDSSSSPTLTDATFSSNTAGELGGAMYNDNSSNLTLTNITFSNNTAGDQGGAMYNENSSLTLTNVTFSGNTAIFGGAMSNNNSNNLTLTNVTFSGNMAGDEGGAMYNTGSSPTLTNVTFSSNSASNLGGAMYNYNSSPTLTNATFSGNTAGGQGGAMYNTGSSPTLTNVILWGNTATNSGSQISQNGGTLTINYSIVEGGDTGLENSTAFSSGTGNSDADPLFTDADGPDDTLGTLDDDLSLQACSPAIDAGDNDAISLTTDLAGNPRKVEDTGVDDTGNGTVPIVDIGALEFQGASQSCTIYYVDASAGGANNGATWADAFPNLQDALQAWRNAGDASSEIWIADGTYYPDEGAATDRTGVTLASPDNNRDATFFVSEGIKIYGGFTGGETNRSERNPAANVVTLSGDTDGDNASGSNAYHVMYLDGSTTAITSATVIDGVTVTAGQADRSFPDYPGGGMLNDSSSPTLTNITFSGNTATDGGAMYNRFSSPTLTNVTFSGNTASSDGGAMYNDSSSPTLTNITFSGNTATDGGAMYNYDDSATTLTNVTFSGNSASNDGGAMYNDENIDESSPTLTNVTFSGNMASRDGGAMYNYESGPTLTNVILWGNTATNSGSQISQDGTLTINYSIVEGGDTGLENSTAFSSGTGNSDADPLFTDADGPDDTLGTLDDDLSLQACSPAIDAGDNTAISLTTDLAGNPRKVDDTGVADINSGTAPIVDIGAFEFQGTSTNCP